MGQDFNQSLYFSKENKRAGALPALVLCVVVGCGGGAACGVVLPSVEVQGASTLALPSSASPLTVRVEAAGEKISKVWLSLHMNAPERYELSIASGGTFSLDPTDSAVTEALRSGGGRGVAFLFASFESGVKAVSAPIHYTIEGLPERLVELPELPLDPTKAKLRGHDQPLHLSGRVPEIRLPQRTTVPLPGSQGRILLSVGDITGGVISEVLLRQGMSPITQSQGMQRGQTLQFYVGNTLYSLTLDAVTDTSMGGDFATFTLREGSPPQETLPQETLPQATLPQETTPSGLTYEAVNQAQVREMLIARVSEQTGLTLIRNGEAYNAQQAAVFLRVKMNAIPADLALSDVIDQHLTYSSESGQPYLVRHENGAEEFAADWLRRVARDAGLLP